MSDIITQLQGAQVTGHGGLLCRAAKPRRLRRHGFAGRVCMAAASSTEVEANDRGIRSLRYHMNAARFLVHRNPLGFDFEQSKVDKQLISQLATLEFTDAAQNLVLVGGTGTGKTHLATAIGVAGIQHHGKRVRFYSTVDLANTLEQDEGGG